jgi:Family of unknown function (DUF6328)
MKLSEKMKIALDETRILILGAQILLGFGFRGVFSERFDELPGYARCANGVGLGLLVCAIGLLIAPGPYHRIAEGGQDSGRLHRFVTVIADLALLPFALALGLGLFVGTEAIFDDSVASAAAGAAGAGLALALWYGLPQLRKRFVGKRERMITRGQSSELTDTPLHVKIEQLLTEARVVLPGAQALFGFQLAIVLTRAFEQLPKVSIVVHAASLFLVALAVMMLMAPARLSQDRLWGRGYRRHVPGRQRARDGGDPAARFGIGGRCLRRNRENFRVFGHRLNYRRAGFRIADWALVPVPDHCGAPPQAEPTRERETRSEHHPRQFPSIAA